MTSTSIWNLHCGFLACKDHMQLQVVTSHAHGPTGGHVNQALIDAATKLGWRLNVSNDVITCPYHARELVCARCASKECSCMGGQRFEARNP